MATAHLTVTNNLNCIAQLEYAQICFTFPGRRYASGTPLTPTPTPVAPLGAEETREVPTAFKPISQDPVYDPTEGASESALPSAGNDQIDNPLFEDQQQQDISGTAYDQGTASYNTSHVPFASPRQQEFYSTMYASPAAALQRNPSTSLSDTSLSSLDVSEQQSAQYESSSHGRPEGPFASMGNPAFSDQPLLGSAPHQSPAASRQQAPSVAASTLDSFYRGPFFPRKSSLTLPAQPAEPVSVIEPVLEETPGTAQPHNSYTPVHESHAFCSQPLLGGPQQQVHQPEAFTEAIPAPAAQQVQFAKPLNIPPQFEMLDDEQQYYDQHVAASPVAAEPPSPEGPVVVTQRTAFADGPMFNGTPLSSPTDPNELAAPVPVQQKPIAALVEAPAFHQAPVFRDNPVFSELEEQQQTAPSAALAEQTAAEGSPAFYSRPFFGDVEQQQEPMLPAVTPQQEAVAFSDPESVNHSPAFSSKPIFGAPAQQQQQPPQVHTSAQLAMPVQLEPSRTVPAPTAADQGPAFSSQPIFGASVQQQQVHAPAQLATPMQPQPAVAEPVTAGQFSSEPIFGARQQQQQQPPPQVHSPAPVASPVQQESPVEQAPAFSSQPIFGGQPQQQQHQEVFTPPQFSAPARFEADLDEPLEDPLYDPTRGRPAYLQQPTPAVINSPTFQSRPVLGGFDHQQQQQQGQLVSADNPWASRESMLAHREPSFAEREPSFALPTTSASPRQGGISFHDNSLFESSDQPQILSDGVTFHSTPMLSPPVQQSAYSPPLSQPMREQQSTAAPASRVNQGMTFHSESPFDAPQVEHQRSSPLTSPPAPVPVPVPGSSFSSQPILGPQAPMDTTQRTAQLDTAQRTHFSPASTFITPASTRAVASSPGVAFSNTPPLGGWGAQVSTTPVAFTDVEAQPTVLEEPLSDPMYDPTQRAVRALAASARPAALLEPLDDPLYDPVQRRPTLAQSTITQVKPVVLQPLDDPLYDPTVQRPNRAVANPSAAPHGPHGSHKVAAQNSRFLQSLDDPLYDPAAVEAAPGLQKDVTHRGEQVGTPHFARQQQQPSAFADPASTGAASQGRAQGVSTGDFATRPLLGGARRPPRTVNLTDIGRPVPMPQVQQQAEAVPEPKPEYELGGADVLPQDDHYVKPTPYDELGPNARSALSGAGWKSTWANEMEQAAQRGGQGIIYMPLQHCLSFIHHCLVSLPAAPLL